MAARDWDLLTTILSHAAAAQPQQSRRVDEEEGRQEGCADGAEEVA